VDSAGREGSRTLSDPRIAVIPDVHGHAKGEHRAFAEERPIAYSARMLFLWFYHAARRGSPHFLMVADHINYLTFEDPGAINTVRRALKLAEAGDLYGAAETAGVEVAHAAAVSEGLRRGMRFSIGAEVDNDPRSRPDAQNIVDAMRPDGIIRSVHFVTIDHPEKGPDWSWPFDNEEFIALYDVVGIDKLWELYMAKLLDDLEKLPGQIVGHFYVPSKFGHWPDRAKLEEYEDRLLDLCHARGLAVEVNTRILYRSHSEEHRKAWIEANARLIRKARERGVGIAVGSDAHSPKDQGNGFDVALKLLDDAEVNEIVFPVGGRLARVALRATREHLEQQTKSKETTAPGSSISGLSRAELGLPEEIEKPAPPPRATRETGPKKRAASPERTSKSPDATEPPTTKSSSRRTAESSSSSSKAKAARAAKAAQPEPTPEPEPQVAPAPPPPPAAPAKTATKAVKKPVAKAPAKLVSKAKPAAKKTKTAAAKAPAKKPAATKTPAKKMTAKKAPAKKPAAVAKRTRAKSAAKPTAKKAVKKPARASTKKAAPKKKTTAKRR
jgi:HisJ family histidinol phosphate phosphatase